MRMCPHMCRQNPLKACLRCQNPHFLSQLVTALMAECAKCANAATSVNVKKHLNNKQFPGRIVPYINF